MFVDQVEIDVAGGDGGNGSSSFRRERYVPKGGPDGGNGGHGGSVSIIADADVTSLAALTHRRNWAADKGRNGEGGNRRGRNGEDIEIRVPPGTIVFDVKHDFVLKDLAQDGDSFIAAHGGKGGWGNTHFKSSTHQAPRERMPGEPGESRRLRLELKVIADVGLVGRPNAGKSTLLSRLTKARPEIADYPFTTKHPNLGQVQVDFDRSFVMADIPGLIEGAHQGIGLGHEFLRHIERSGILVHLVEPMPIDGTDAIENYQSIRHELTEYKQELGERPEIIAVTKAELPGAEDVRDLLAETTGNEVLLISAVTGAGLNDLTHRVAAAIEAAAKQASE